MQRRFEQEVSSAAVVMSFDFEMRWGVHDLYGLNFDGYRRNLESCRPVVLATLNLLSERKLCATWATVGALGVNDWNDYFSCAPPPPEYVDPHLAVRKEYASMDPDGIFHFAPDLIRQIVQTEGQELGNHSFSHLYFREPGVRQDDFFADMAAVENLFKARFGVVPVSLVYPRNQSAFTDQLNKTSIKKWRGSEPAWFYDCTSTKQNTMFPRALRLVDSLNPWAFRASPCESEVVRASMFVRFSLPESLWKLQIMRIRNEIKALQQDDVFHLWWHPHNVRFDLRRGLPRLTQILDIVAETCMARKIASRSMKDCKHVPMQVANH